ncbi:WD-40 repeat-containing protein, partial [Reticulomyxa filosa]
MKQFVINNFNLSSKHVLFRNAQDKDKIIDDGQDLRHLWEEVLSNRNSLTVFQIIVDAEKQFYVDFELVKHFHSHKTFFGHTFHVNSIDYSTFNHGRLLCSGSADKTVRIWDIETTKEIHVFNGHLNEVYCVKFLPYFYHVQRRAVICSSSADKTIRFWDISNKKEFQVFDGHTARVCGIEFSPFHNGRYLCSVSADKTIGLWDIETSKILYVFNGHTNWIWCVAFSPLQSNNTNSKKKNGIGVIGGNGYTICSGSYDNTIRMWDIETTKELLVFKGHNGA